MALTKLNNKAVANVTSLPVALGDMVLVSSATASSSASIEFTLGNYKEYQFYWVDCHPSSETKFGFQVSTDNGSTYATIATTTYFDALHIENDTNANLLYRTTYDLAQSTGLVTLCLDIGAGQSDTSTAGLLHLYNPSSTTYVKHFISRSSGVVGGDYAVDDNGAGYFNTTSALTNIKFQFAGANMDTGTILMYGIN